MSTHELDLLENALDSLGEALSKFEDGDDGDEKSYKFAVLHMAHFIELVFKHHISSTHHLLIFKNPFAKKLNQNQTIGLWECINFINNEDPTSITADLRKDLEWIKRLRNDIEHHKFTMNVHEVRNTMGRLFRSVMEFLEDYADIDVESHIPAHTKEIFKVLSDEYEFSIRNAIRNADTVEEENPTGPEAEQVRFDCPDCGHFTLVVNDESSTGFLCTFCGNEESEELLGSCSICGTTVPQGELDYWELDDGGEEARCYYCSGRYHADKDD